MLIKAGHSLEVRNSHLYAILSYWEVHYSALVMVKPALKVVHPFSTVMVDTSKYEMTTKLTFWVAVMGVNQD